ncbi:hypothetical protein JQ607_32740 [Bradyrhizobium liaoningense]|uniref:hypothetical protein n=1 Tax=Bradyrhizobium liaoningense TaxID=43992 RepID=UPI001BA875AB|nr:hypothetical protein [Bradyrhizobium liaoningense]MBR0844990.1 hypothetical protein [Bradyrhizobium liaoningense]MBR0856773.1 hypothetical protein [Bradyrhizobium liaoningense]
MPGKDDHLRRIHDEAAAIARHSAHIRDLLTRSFEILQQPLPDTFLGRKTYEPFPTELSFPLERER